MIWSSPPGDAAIAARRDWCVTARSPRSTLPISIATRSMPRSRSATIRNLPTSRSSSAAANAAWSRPPATSRAPYGVRSAMPMFKALALCPSAIVIRPDMAKYVRVGREVRRAMQALTPLVEPLSIDEAFLDLSGTQRVHGMIPAKVLARFAQAIEREIGVTVSVGLSCNKFLAKIASDLDKPRGFATLDQDEARTMLADKAGRLHLWRRTGDARAPGPARLSPHRRSAARRRNRVDEAIRRRGTKIVAAGARHRRPARGARSRRQDDLERNHLRDRHPRLRDPRKAVVAAVGEGLRQTEKQRTWRDRPSR